MSTKLPPASDWLARTHPDVWEAYTRLGEVCGETGPLDARTKRLVKLALAIGARSEGAVHSHTRQAIDQGIPRDDLEHVALLAITTLGFPQAMAVLTWMRDVTEDG